MKLKIGSVNNIFIFDWNLIKKTFKTYFKIKHLNVFLNVS